MRQKTDFYYKNEFFEFDDVQLDKILQSWPSKFKFNLN